MNLLLAAALTAVVVVAWHQLPSSADAHEVDQLSRAQRATQTADMMHDALHSDVLAARLEVYAPDRGFDAVQKSLKADAQEFRQQLALLSSMDLAPALKEQTRSAHELGMAYVERAEEIVKLSATDPKRAVAPYGAFNESFEAAKSALAAQTALIAQHLDTANANARRATEDARRWLLAAAVVTIVGGWIGVALIARSIRRSLMGLRDVAKAVAAGNLERRSEQQGRDEVGQLAASVNQMADNLHRMIEHMRADADRGAFGQQLVNALDMADSEAQAHQVVTRAMGQISSRYPMELLLADSSEAHLERAAQHPVTGAAGCGVESPFSCVAVRRGHAVSFPDSEALDACPRLRGRPEGSVTAACIPVTFMGRALGVLHACSPVAQPIEQEVLERLNTLGAQVGSRIGTVRAFERTQLQASSDALTGLANRRSAESRLRELLREQQGFAFVMADLDRFKLLNDTYGHQAGDEALRAFADVARECVRQGDLACRWGGEEFAFILIGADASTAVRWVDRLREHLAQALRRRSAPAFTASFGVADSAAGLPLESMVAAADLALYRAKSEGRDRAVLAGSDDVAAEWPVQRHSEPTATIDVRRLAVNG